MSGQIRVVLRLFSGLPNPEWSVPDQLAGDVLKMLGDLPVQPKNFRPEIIKGKPDDSLGRPKSGFRGFQIFADPESRVPLFQVYGQLVLDQAIGLIRTDGTDRLEEVVWKTAPPEVIKDLDNITLAEVRAPENEALIQDVEGEYVDLNCGESPAYTGDRDRFNDFDSENNCYNYATTKLNTVPRSRPAVPGQANRRRAFTVAQLQFACEQDMLTNRQMTQPSHCPPEDAHWVAAMVRHRATRLRDVHFLRLDRTGRWSHKDGDGPVDNTDDQGHLITDLTQAHFVGEPILAGFYLVHQQHLNLIN